MTAAAACLSPSAESTFQLGPAQSNKLSAYFKILTLTYINYLFYTDLVVFQVLKPNVGRNEGITKHIFDPEFAKNFVDFWNILQMKRWP